MMNPVGLTSRWVAASRAMEPEAQRPLFDDPFARDLAGEEGFRLHAVMREYSPAPPSGGGGDYLAIRTRFFDDALLAATTELGLKQVAILAAGMDARAFRLAWPEGVTLFEVDRPEVLDYKEAVLADLGAQPGCDRRVVRADLEQDWRTPLVAAGLDAAAPTAFLVEGLLPYLEESAALALFQSLREIAAVRSWLGVDMVGVDLLASTFMKPFFDKLEELGCPWRYGVSDPEPLLARCGWEAKVVTPGDPEANYGRWPYPVLPRSVSGVPRSYLALARRVE